MRLKRPNDWELRRYKTIFGIYNKSKKTISIIIVCKSQYDRLNFIIIKGEKEYICQLLLFMRSINGQSYNYGPPSSRYKNFLAKDPKIIFSSVLFSIT